MSGAFDWRQRALCGSEPEAWFPEEVRPASAKRLAVNAAVGSCRRCPVRRDCRAEVLERESGTPADMRFGVFAAMTPKERAGVDPLVQDRKRVAA